MTWEMQLGPIHLRVTVSPKDEPRPIGSVIDDPLFVKSLQDAGISSVEDLRDAWLATEGELLADHGVGKSWSDERLVILESDAGVVGAMVPEPPDPLVTPGAAEDWSLLWRYPEADDGTLFSQRMIRKGPFVLLVDLNSGTFALAREGRGPRAKPEIVRRARSVPEMDQWLADQRAKTIAMYWVRDHRSKEPDLVKLPVGRDPIRDIWVYHDPVRGEREIQPHNVYEIDDETAEAMAKEFAKARETERQADQICRDMFSQLENILAEWPKAQATGFPGADEGEGGGINHDDD